MAVDLTTTVARTAGLMTAPVDNDIVILNMKGNNYISLDHIGRRIWDLIEEPVVVSELCRQLTQEFQGPQEQITADVLLFLTRLESEGLIRVIGE